MLPFGDIQMGRTEKQLDFPPLKIVGGELGGHSICTLRVFKEENQTTT